MVTTTLDVSVVHFRNRVLIRYQTDDVDPYKGPITFRNLEVISPPEIVQGMALAYLYMHDVGFEVDVEPIFKKGLDDVS